MSYGLFGPLGGMVGVLLGAVIGGLSGCAGMAVACIILGTIGYGAMVIVALGSARHTASGVHRLTCPKKNREAELTLDPKAAAWALLRGDLLRVERCSLCGGPPVCERGCEEPLTELLDHGWGRRTDDGPPAGPSSVGDAAFRAAPRARSGNGAHQPRLRLIVNPELRR